MEESYGKRGSTISLQDVWFSNLVLRKFVDAPIPFELPFSIHCPTRWCVWQKKTPSNESLMRRPVSDLLQVHHHLLAIVQMPGRLFGVDLVKELPLQPLLGAPWMYRKLWQSMSVLQHRSSFELDWQGLCCNSHLSNWPPMTCSASQK